jgi:hypothetical protein
MLSIWKMCKYIKNKSWNIIFKFLSFLGSPVHVQCTHSKPIVDLIEFGFHSTKWFWNYSFFINPYILVQWTYVHCTLYSYYLYRFTNGKLYIYMDVQGLVMNCTATQLQICTGGSCTLYTVQLVGSRCKALLYFYRAVQWVWYHDDMCTSNTV